MADEEGDAGQEGLGGLLMWHKTVAQGAWHTKTVMRARRAGGAADAAQDGAEPTADGEVADEGTDAGEEGPRGGRSGTRSWFGHRPTARAR
eukprot:jgi/Ulvmu1/12286/UM088_0001.1